MEEKVEKIRKKEHKKQGRKIRVNIRKEQEEIRKKEQKK